MFFLRKQEVLEIQHRLIEEFGGIHGIRDEGLLDSALSAPENRLHYEGANVATCAATYAYHLTQAHAFLDGNKRLGAAASEIFAAINGRHSIATNEEVVELFLSIAAGSVSRHEVEAAFERWLKSA